MTTAFLSPILNDAQFNDDGTFLVGGLVWFYVAGTSTPLAAYTGPDARTPWPNPIVLDARGETGGEIWLNSTQVYKIILEAAPLQGSTHGVVVSTFDNINGIASLISPNANPDNWILSNQTPTYISGTSFSVLGDQRSIFQTYRRVKSINNALSVYSSVVSTTYDGTKTTIVVQNDSSSLNAGLNSVYYGVIETNPSSIPPLSSRVKIIGDTMTGALNVPAGASGTQVPRAQEVVLKTGSTMTGALNVPAGASGTQVPQAQEVVLKTGNATITGNIRITPSVISATEPTNFLVTRNANYTGGTFGYVNSAISANTTVGAGAASFEWAITGVMNNYAVGGQNVGVYGQGNKYAGAGPTWGGVFEARDKSSNNNPTSGLIGIEVDCFANGTDTNLNRVGIDVVFGKGVTPGTQCSATYGVRVAATNLDTTAARIDKAFSVVGIQYNIGFDTVSGSMLSGGCAIRILENTPIVFGGSSTSKLMYYNTSVSALEYNPGSTTAHSASYVRFEETGQISTTGALNINGSQVVTNRQTGYTPMTGTGDTSSVLNPATVTLPYLAARVLSLQASLTIHGLIGA